MTQRRTAAPGGGPSNHPPPSYRRHGCLPARLVAEVGVRAVADPGRAVLGVLDAGRGSVLSGERKGHARCEDGCQRLHWASLLFLVAIASCDVAGKEGGTGSADTAEPLMRRRVYRVYERWFTAAWSLCTPAATTTPGC